MEKLFALKKRVGTWKEVAKVLGKSERQVHYYKDGVTPITKELRFYIDHLLKQYSCQK